MTMTVSSDNKDFCYTVTSLFLHLFEINAVAELSVHQRKLRKKFIMVLTKIDLLIVTCLIGSLLHHHKTISFVLYHLYIVRQVFLNHLEVACSTVVSCVLTVASKAL